MINFLWWVQVLIGAPIIGAIGSFYFSYGVQTVSISTVLVGMVFIIAALLIFLAGLNRVCSKENK